MLQEGTIPLVVSDCEFPGGSRKELLAEIADLPDGPLLIVSSRVADEHLWAEALNRGGDVVSKPFGDEEVIRVFSLAWLHWKDTREFQS